MVKLYDFIYELLCDVGLRIQVKGNHSSHLVCENFDEVDPRVGTDYNLISQTCWLHLINMTDCFESLTDHELQGTD